MAAAVEHQPHKTAANYEREKDAEDHGYVAMEGCLEHQPHKTAANYEREKDAEDHGYVAMDAQYCSRHK
jgi:hypothetical protein